MLQRFLIAVPGLLAAGTLMADFSYVQTSQVTGGQMAAMMRMAGGLSGRGNQPTTTSHYLKGDKMATVSSTHSTIVDVAAETITEVDFQKKSYSVMTFAQMKQMMEQLGGKTGTQTPDFKVSANRTGATKKVSGVEAKEIVITMEAEMKDQKSGRSSTMKITTDSWISSEVLGYDEVREFYKKMASKIDWSPGGSAPMMGRPDLAKGMEQVAKEMAKLDGVPVLQVVKMGSPGGQDMPQMTPEQQARMESAQGQADAARAQAAQQQPKEQLSASSAIAGALGVPKFGGFGKKKPTEKPQAAETPAAQAPVAAPAPAAGRGDPSVFLETTLESSAFSTASVDASKVEVPSGFTKVDTPRMGR